MVKSMGNVFFGKNGSGEEASLYTLKNKNGMIIKVTDYGATLQSVIVPGKDNNNYDVVLGYDTLQGYEKKVGTFYGATVGRNANRMKNARFQLNGCTFELEKNDNGNSLHSGKDCFSYRMWKVKAQSDNSITFSIFSPDGDQGFPGNVEVSVTYVLTDENEVRIEYCGETDADTILNLTNHSYFNLNGHASGTILEHDVWIDADYYLRTDCESIPTGEILSVEHTPMDFRMKKAIGKDIDEDYEAIVLGKGYDHNWCLNRKGLNEKVAELSSDKSGITMEVYTDLPGVQMYTGNYIENDLGKEGARYNQRQGVCFETQYYPDAMNHDNFESPIFSKENPYKSVTMYKFIWE